LKLLSHSHGILLGSDGQGNLMACFLQTGGEGHDPMRFIVNLLLDKENADRHVLPPSSVLADAVREETFPLTSS
jgi:hypothetical protein